MSKVKYPEEIYVEREFDGNVKDNWLVSYENLDDAAEIGKDKKIAVYQLVEMRTVKNRTELI